MDTKNNFNEKRISEIEEEISYYQNTLLSEIDDSLSNVKKIAIIGGIITAGFAVTKLLINEKSAPEKSEIPKESSFLGKTVKGIATTIILTILKKQLTKLIEDFNSNEQGKNS